MFRQHRPYVFNMLRKIALAFSVVSVSPLLCFQYSAQLRRYVFSPSTKMSLTKIDFSTTPPLRFQYAATDSPCVFSSQREPKRNSLWKSHRLPRRISGSFRVVFASFSKRERPRAISRSLPAFRFSVFGNAGAPWGLLGACLGTPCGLLGAPWGLLGQDFKMAQDGLKMAQDDPR